MAYENRSRFTTHRSSVHRLNVKWLVALGDGTLRFGQWDHISDFGSRMKASASILGVELKDKACSDTQHSPLHVLGLPWPHTAAPEGKALRSLREAVGANVSFLTHEELLWSRAQGLLTATDHAYPRFNDACQRIQAFRSESKSRFDGTMLNDTRLLEMLDNGVSLSTTGTLSPIVRKGASTSASWGIPK